MQYFLNCFAEQKSQEKWNDTYMEVCMDASNTNSFDFFQNIRQLSERAFLIADNLN